MRRPSLPLVLLLVSPTVIAGGIAFALMNWRSPSHVQLQLSTDRLLFRIGGREASQVLNSVAIRSVTIESYSRLQLTPDRGEYAETADFSESQHAPESSWKPLRLTPPVIFNSGQAFLQPSITIEPAQVASQTLGTLDKVWAKPGTLITVDSSDAHLKASVKFSGQPTLGILSLSDTFNLFSDYAQVSGINTPSTQPDSQAFRFHLPVSSPQAEVTGASNSLVFFLTLPDGKPPAVFSPDPIPVDAIDLTRQSSQGNVESSIVGASELIYPDDPKADRIKLDPSDFLTLGDLSQFRIKTIELDPSTHSLRLTAAGFAGVIRTGTPGFVQDRRLTHFDRLRHNPLLLLLFSVAAWAFPTTVAGYKLYKEVAE